MNEDDREDYYDRKVQQSDETLWLAVRVFACLLVLLTLAQALAS